MDGFFYYYPLNRIKKYGNIVDGIIFLLVIKQKLVFTSMLLKILFEKKFQLLVS